MTDGFLHLTDADEGTPVRIRINSIDALYVELDEQVEVRAFHGHSPVAVREREPFTMIVYGGRYQHGVKETIEKVESQMADFYELAGIAAAQ